MPTFAHSSYLFRYIVVLFLASVVFHKINVAAPEFREVGLFEDLSNIYSGEKGDIIEQFALSSLIQYQFAFVNSEQGSADDFTFRRFSIGQEARLFGCLRFSANP